MKHAVFNPTRGIWLWCLGGREQILSRGQVAGALLKKFFFRLCNCLWAKNHDADFADASRTDKTKKIPAKICLQSVCVHTCPGVQGLRSAF